MDGQKLERVHEVSCVYEGIELPCLHDPLASHRPFDALPCPLDPLVEAFDGCDSVAVAQIEHS